jgi:hypothetical protein
MFSIKNGLKQGAALTLLLYNSVLAYAIMRVQIQQDGLIFNGKCQFLVYTVGNILGEVYILQYTGLSVHTTKKNKEDLVVVSKEIGLEVNADKISTWSCLNIRTQDEITI